MKKGFLSLVLASALVLAACSSHKTEEVSVVTVDTTVVADSTVTTVVDSLAADTAK